MTVSLRCKVLSGESELRVSFGGNSKTLKILVIVAAEKGAKGTFTVNAVSKGLKGSAVTLNISE